MNRPFPWRMLMAFGAKFGLALLVFAPLWWLCLPGYGWLLVQGCGSIARWILGVPVVAGHVAVNGVLHTESELVFYVGDRARAMKFALLATNLPPYLALVLATPGITGLRRMRTLLAGSAILVMGHLVYVLVALSFGEVLATYDEVSTAMAQFLLTLPLLLWIVMAYWRRDEPGM